MLFPQHIVANWPHFFCLGYMFSIILCLALTPDGAQAVPLTPNGANIEYKRYCSNTLSDAIRLICGGRYNSLARKFPDSVGTYRSLRRLTSNDGIFYRPLYTGPIHECCERPCGYSELKQYCAPD